MKKLFSLISLFFLNLLILLASNNSFARPEFALKFQIHQCSMCHNSPYGGGARNIFGKSIGNHGFISQSPFAANDLIYGDFRMINSAARNSKVSSGGISLMSVSATFNIPLYQITKQQKKEIFTDTEADTETDKDTVKVTDPENENGNDIENKDLDKEVNVNSNTISNTEFENIPSTEIKLITQFISPELQQGGGISYLQFKDLESANYFFVGKFYRSFGIPSDEHRTFTKMINNSSIRDFIYGFGGSSFFNDWQIDFSFGNDVQYATLIKDPAWIYSTNVRKFLTPIPLFINLAYEKIQNPSNKHSQALAMGASFYSEDLSTTITSEVVRTQNYNPLMKQSSFFYGSNSIDLLFQNTISNREAQAVSTIVSYEYSDKLTYLLKHDEFAFDFNYPADAFIKNNFGLRYYWGPNLFIQSEIELHTVGRKDLDPSTRSNSNGIYALIRASL